MEKRETGRMLKVLSEEGERVQHVGRGVITCRPRYDHQRKVWFRLVMEWENGKWEGFVALVNRKENS